MTTSTLAPADRIAKAAIAHARGGNKKPSGMVVVDASTHVKVARRENGANLAPIDIATGKARAALTFGCTSKQIADALARNALARPSVLGVLGGRIVLLGGGVLITDAAGKTIGAVGVAGGASYHDETLASAAAGAF